MNSENNIPSVEPGIPSANAVSLYGQQGGDAMDDFPVLKAFQQYVDAEQAKAQKRMTTLCIFFAVILTVVVGVFVALILSMSQAKNEANDKLLSYMMQERERSLAAPAQPVANPQADAAVKALTDTVTTLQKQMADQQMKMIEEKQKAAEEAIKRATEAAKAAASSAPQPPSPEQLALEAKNKTDADKILKATALLAKQREELKKERELLHQKEVDLQRRKLYPDYYRKLESPARKVVPADKDEVEDDSLTYFDEDDEDEVKENKATPVRKSDGSFRYFDDPDEEKSTGAGATDAHDALLKSEGAASNWTLPLD